MSAATSENLDLLRSELLAWYRSAARDLPWRRTRDPYAIWISEVLLQQTQVVTGTAYYLRFLEAFPTVQDLAAAPQQAVLKAWEGCGYYARARNLHRAAQEVVVRGMPTTYEGWLALPGVGPYTAAAVASIAFAEPRAVVDGNVRRVLGRLHAELQPSSAWLQARADALLERAAPGDWNQAVMELGATVCTPKKPACTACPLRAHCAAYASGMPERYPAPKARAAVKHIRAVALLIGDAQRLYLERRPENSLLGGLLGLPLEAVGEDEAPEAALGRLEARLKARRLERLGEVRHVFTHRRLDLEVWRAEADLPLTVLEAVPVARVDAKAVALLRAQPGLF
ncbi:A/G-specific adenine glycosylase [Deinobacterium chartae]|uniref:Adenine DNA glycosylase n=1 Tax=Deinobacterium chartae TaxID=521158 RepID=A0A841I351_9DEIO|nr:A/G-specific adenine glycosylase [Deinobacterium chartae]